MNLANSSVLVVVALAAAFAIAWALRRYFSPDARRERRRRRSNTRLTSTAKRPMVRFSVRTKRNRRS